MTDLTDRMRTCAARILATKAAGDPWAAQHVALHAADLLLEAGDILEPLQPVDLGTPMAVIQPVSLTKKEDWSLDTAGTWIAPGGPLPGLTHSGTASLRPCPYCNSRGIKTVRRVENKLMLECPVCAETWEFKR